MTYTEQPRNNSEACLKLAEQAIAENHLLRLKVTQLTLQASDDVHTIKHLRQELRKFKRMLANPVVINESSPMMIKPNQAH
jgi:hypothetical protein